MNQKALEQQFLDLANIHQGIIHKVCNMYAKDEEHRKDLFQEVLVQWWRAFPSFKGDSKFTTWGYRVAINTAVSDFRKNKRHLGHQDISEEVKRMATAPFDFERKERHHLLHTAINQLTKVEKAIIMLYMEEHSYDEIANIIGITKTNVGVKINRIKAKLKKMLSPHIE